MALTFVVPGLDEAASEKAIAILQNRLSQEQEAALVLKHAHWNVTGPNFIAVHEMLAPQVAAMLGLAAEGYIDEAVRIAEGLVRAADAFGYQNPELYAGDAGEGGPAPYPAACHPQAWSAASSVAVASLLLGLTPDGEGRPIDSPLALGLSLTRE